MSNDAWHTMRASDADRERAADVLRAALAEGRLTQDEHSDRIRDVYNARTYGELERTVNDLPSGLGQAMERRTAPAVAHANPPYAPVPVRQKTNDLAMVSAVCGALGFMTGITAIPAIITGHMALSRINRTGEDGRGLAIAGLVMGYGLTALGVLMVIMMGLFMAGMPYM